MLGEAARTAADAERYLAPTATRSPRSARAAGRRASRRPGLSVKLSALHPRYEKAQRARMMAELTPRLLALAEAAGRPASASPSTPRRPTGSIFRSISSGARAAPRLAGWDGLGLAVQAYQKRALPLSTGSRISPRSRNAG